MPWKAVSLMSLRLDFCLQADQPGSNVSDLCRKFDISRDVGYKWLRRWRACGVAGLEDRSRQPHRSPRRSSDELEDAVVALRHKHPAWGPRKLRALLAKDIPDSLPGVSTVARILKRRGLIEPLEAPPLYPSVERFERGEPNELWQMDLKAAIRLADRRKVYPVGIIDDHSRYLIGLRMIPDFSERSVIDCWIAAAKDHGLPESTLTDHGSQFRMEDESSSAFRVFLWACGVEHTQGRIKHPQTQGKIERFWGTLNREVLRCRSYRDLVSWQSCFDDFRQEYNTVRPHQELGDVPPASRYRPSDRQYAEPDRRYHSEAQGRQIRMTDAYGRIGLNSRQILLGRGYAGWTVEAAPLGAGCWHIYFRGRFIKEVLFRSER